MTTLDPNYEQALDSANPEICVRLDFLLGPRIDLRFEGSSTIASGKAFSIDATPADDRDRLEKIRRLETTSISLTVTEGATFDRTQSGTLIATSIGMAINASTTLSGYLYARYEGNRLSLYGRNGVGQISIKDTSTAVGDFTLPAGVTLQTGQENPNTGSTFSVNDSPEAISYFGGVSYPLLAAIKHGAETGQAVTRESTREKGDIFLKLSPPTTILLTEYDLYYVPVEVKLGVRQAGFFDGTWAFADLYYGFADLMRPNELGRQYHIPLLSLPGALMEFGIAGQWVHMHPLDIARTIQEEAGLRPNATFDPGVDLTRSHFSCYRATDKLLERRPWWTEIDAERWDTEFEEPEEDDRTLGWDPDDAILEFLQRARNRAAVLSSEEVAPEPPVVDGAITETEPAQVLLDEIALMMNGGIFDDANGLSFYPYDADGAQDYNFGREWRDLAPIDNVKGLRFECSYGIMASEQGQRRSIVFESPGFGGGGEFKLTFPFVNAVSELRTPMGATIDRTGAIRTAVDTYLTITFNGGEQEPSAGQDPLDIVNFPGTPAVFTQTGFQGGIYSIEIRSRTAGLPSAIDVEVIRDDTGAVIASGNFYIDLTTTALLRAELPAGTQITISITKPPGLPVVYVSDAVARPGGDWDGGDLFFYDDKSLIVANPCRGFCGARVRWTGSSFLAAESGAELDPSAGRVAYLEMIGIEYFEDEGITLPITDRAGAEAAYDPQTRMFPEAAEIIVAGSYTGSVGINADHSEWLAVDRSRDTLRNQHAVLYEVPRVAGRQKTWMFNDSIEVRRTQEDTLRAFLPMRLQPQVATTWNDDGATAGRAAFPTSANGNFRDEVGNIVVQSFAGKVPYAVRIAQEHPQRLPRVFPSGRYNIPLGVVVPSYFGKISDITIPVYVAKAHRARFEGGAAVVSLHLPLKYAFMPRFSRVTIHAPELNLPGSQGISDGVTDATLDKIVWEVTGKQIFTEGDRVGVQVELTELKRTGGIPPAQTAPTARPTIPSTPIIPIAASGRVYAEGDIANPIEGTAALTVSIGTVNIGTPQTFTLDGDGAPSSMILTQPSASNRYLTVAYGFTGSVTGISGTYGTIGGTLLNFTTDGNTNLAVFGWTEANIAAATGTTLTFSFGTGTPTDSVVTACFFDGTSGAVATNSATTSDPIGDTLLTSAGYKAGSRLTGWCYNNTGASPTANSGTIFDIEGFKAANTMVGISEDSGEDAAAEIGLDYSVAGGTERVLISFVLPIP